MFLYYCGKTLYNSLQCSLIEMLLATLGRTCDSRKARYVIVILRFNHGSYLRKLNPAKAINTNLGKGEEN